MKQITDRTSYLRGLAEGLNIDKEKAENKLMLEMLNVMDEMAQKIQELDGDVDELDEYVASMESDLSDVEEMLFSDGDGEEPGEDYDDYTEDEDIDVNCPHCGKEFTIKAGDVDFDEDVLCPACGKTILDTDGGQEKN
jgi:DNA-directed RNA polymerase subunit delta